MHSQKNYTIHNRPLTFVANQCNFVNENKLIFVMLTRTVTKSR